MNALADQKVDPNTVAPDPLVPPVPIKYLSALLFNRKIPLRVRTVRVPEGRAAQMAELENSHHLSSTPTTTIIKPMAEMASAPMFTADNR